MDLVILAAGMGSRFGGLKQLEPIDEYGNFIIDYSVYDALRAGFDRVIFIIKEEHYDVFKETIGARVEKRIKVEYCFQSLKTLPEGYALPKEREKPLGTAQALLAVKDVAGKHFIIINADDFYGYDAFKVAADYFKSLDSNSENLYANVAYKVENTLTENGSVKRGVLFSDEDGNLKDIIESKIEKVDGKIVATPLDDEDASFEVSDDTVVSMNMFAFTGDYLKHVVADYAPFLDKHSEDLMKCEYLVPSHVGELIQAGKVKVKVLSTDAQWHGITYREDKDHVVSSIKALMDSGKYPKGLW